MFVFEEDIFAFILSFVESSIIIINLLLKISSICLSNSKIFSYSLKAGNIIPTFNEETLKFFKVHQHADKWHRKVVRKLLGEVCNSEVKKEEALDAIDQALFCLNNFLTGMERVYC